MSAEHDALLRTLKRTAAVLKPAGLDFALAGSYAAYARGGPPPEHDVDFCLRKADLVQALSVLGEAGFRIEDPSEDWLAKAYDGEQLVDLIYQISGVPVDGLIERAGVLNVGAIDMPVLCAADLIITKALSFGPHSCDFVSALGTARALREQVDWARVRRETAQSPFAKAFLTLLEELEIIDPEETPASASASASACAGAHPYLVGRIESRLAEDAATAQLGLEIIVTGAGVEVSGVVPSAGLCDLITRVIRQEAGDIPVRCDLDVVASDPPVDHEVLS